MYQNCRYTIQGQLVCIETFNQLYGIDGSYGSTCSNCVIYNREDMSCKCQLTTGENEFTSSIHLPSCPTNYIINKNGKLACQQKS
jgi:hypothetical protein